MLTRIDSQNIWIWLPSTNLPGAEIVANKLNNITMENKKIEEAMKTTVFHSSNIDITSTAEALLRDLTNNG